MSPLQDLQTPEGQGATFIELFFDLVFVFAVTQVVGLVHHDPTWSGATHGLLVFWLIWWGWTQFTWALNSANTEHRFIEVMTLVATAIAFVMAYGVPESFADDALWFAIPYVLVRIVGLAVYAGVTWADPGQRGAVMTFGALSTIGLALAVLGALADNPLRSWCWVMVIAADLAAAAVAGKSESWNLQIPHFAERHGLFVIIALGESLIAVGVTASGVERTGSLVTVMLAGTAIACLLWWTYFVWLGPRLEHAAADAPREVQAALARDTYSFLHFPIIFGVICLAVGLEAAVAHPTDPLDSASLAFLVSGVIMFVLSAGLAHWRATGRPPVERLVWVVALALLATLAADASAAWVLTIVIVALVGLIAAEAARGLDAAPD